MTNNIRDFIDIVNETNQINEIDWSSVKSVLTDFGKTLTGDHEARGRLELKSERDHIENGWKKYYTINKVKPTDEKMFKKFLVYWNFGDDEINQILTKPFDLAKSLDKAAAIQWASAKGPTGKNRTPGGQETKPDISQKPNSDSPEDIVRFYKEILKGDTVSVIKDAHVIDADPTNVKSDLEMLGYAYLKSIGKI